MGIIPSEDCDPLKFSGTRQSHMAGLNWMEVFIPEIIKLNGIVQQAMFDYPEYMFIEATNNDWFAKVLTVTGLGLNVLLLAVNGGINGM